MSLLARAAERLTPPRRASSGPRGPAAAPRVKGVAIPSPEVAPTVARLRAFQRDFERVFLALAEGLPGLSASVQALTAPFASLRDPEHGVVRQIEAQVGAMAEVSRGATGGVLAHSEAGLEQARLLAAGAAALVEQLSSVRKISLRLRLAGLNASFSVGGLGHRGAAFSAVNRALIDVAELSAELAEVTAAGVERTRDAAARFGTGQQALSDQLAEVTATTEARGRAALAECSGVLERLGGELGEIIARGAEVQEATGTIMNAIQRQDILRQGLDHVILVLEALQAEWERLAASAQPASSAMAFLAFQERAGRLATDLLHSLREQLEALVAMVQQPVAGLGAAARVIAGRSVDHAGIERSLTAASDRFAEGFAALPPVGGIGTCEAEVGQLEEQLRALKPRLVALEKIPLELDMVTILLRSEIAHLVELSGVSRVADELRGVGQGLRDLNVQAVQAMGTVAARLPLVREAVNRQRAAWAGLRELPARIEGPAARVRDISGSFRGHLDGLHGAGRALDGAAAGLLASLDGFGQALSLTDAIRAACEGWCSEAGDRRQQLQARGLASSEPPPSLQTLIEGFTLFEHKQLALVGPEHHSQDAGAPGELTLF